MFAFQGGVDKNFVDDANPVRIGNHLWWSGKLDATYTYLAPTVGHISSEAPELVSYGVWLQYVLLLNPSRPTLLSKCRAATWVYQNTTVTRQGEGPSWLQLYDMGSALSAWYGQTGYGEFLQASEDRYQKARRVLRKAITDEKLIGFTTRHGLSHEHVPIVFSLVMPAGYSFALESEDHKPLIVLGAYEGVRAVQWFPQEKIMEMAVHESAHVSLKNADFRTTTIPDEFIVESSVRSAGYNIGDRQGLLEEGAVRVVEGLFVKEVLEPASLTVWKHFTNTQYRDGFLFVPFAVDRMWSEKHAHWEVPDVIASVDEVLSSHLSPVGRAASKAVKAKGPSVLSFLDRVRSTGKLHVQVSCGEYRSQVYSYVDNLSAIYANWRGAPLGGIDVSITEGTGLASAEADISSGRLLLLNASEFADLPLDPALSRDLDIHHGLSLQGVRVQREDWWLAVAAPAAGLEDTLLIVNPGNLSTMDALTPWERWSFGVDQDLPVASGGGV